jgi:predicted DNA-binding helix-hairpin-helix protein
VRSAKLIVQGRRFSSVRMEHLKRIGVVLKRARHFISDPFGSRHLGEVRPEWIRALLAAPPEPPQISMFSETTPLLEFAHA